MKKLILVCLIFVGLSSRAQILDSTIINNIYQTTSHHWTAQIEQNVLLIMADSIALAYHKAGSAKDSALHKYGTVSISSVSVPTITSVAPGTSGYVWTSNGSSAYPTWQAAGGGSGSPQATDSIGSDSNSFYINGKNNIIEHDTVYYTPTINNNGGWGALINATFHNFSDGTECKTLYLKKTTHWSVITFPSNTGTILYTPSQSSHGLVSGQTFECQSTTGTSLYEIITDRFNSRYSISIIQLTP